MTLPSSYFDRMYAAAEDPWSLGTRWYERRKYALTLAALPEPRFAAGLEVGCSVGVLTAGLAGRCDALTAVDASEAALRTARGRAPGVEFHHGAVPGFWPAGRYDLVVLSEVGYYLDPADLRALLDRTAGALAPGGCVLACHWRHPVADYPQTGDAVHAELGRRWPRLSRTEEEDFLLEVFQPGGARSVARRTGLVQDGTGPAREGPDREGPA